MYAGAHSGAGRRAVRVLRMEGMLHIGEVLKPQGIRGEIKVKPFTDRAEDFKGLRRVYLDGEEFRILSVRIGEGAVFLGLKGVADRNAAELLRGRRVEILREEAPDPGEGRYYIADLLGSTVLFETGEELGVLIEIRQAGTDIYTVRAGEKEILFPARKGVIVGVSPAEKKLVVDRKNFEEVAVY